MWNDEDSGHFADFNKMGSEESSPVKKVHTYDVVDIPEIVGNQFPKL